MFLKSLKAISRRVPLTFLLTIFFSALILHILATLSYSVFASSSAYQRLEPVLKTNTMTVFPPTTSDKQVLPFLSSDTHLAICRFDTSRSNVTLKATLPEPGWSIVLYDKKGTTLYSDIANPITSSQVDLYIVPDDDRFLGMTLEAQLATNTFNKILIKAGEGLAVLRALDGGYAYQDRTEDLLKKASCSEDRISTKN